MAITVQSQPQLYTPVYNPMRFVLSSNNTAQTNFKYVADVYVSGVVGRVFRGLYDADPTYGSAGVDVSRILESYISSDLSYTTFDFQQCTNSLKGYEVRFGEQYGPSSGIVTYPNLTVTGLKYTWNGVLSPLQFIPSTFNYTLYTSAGGSASLTTKPNDLYYNNANESEWIYFINDSSGVVYYADFNVFDASGNNLSHFKIQNAYQASTAIADKLLRVGVGPRDVLSSTVALLSGSGLLTGATGASYYTVTLTDFFGTSTSETYTYNLECSSRHGNPVRIYFLNRLGGYDVFNFQLMRSLGSDVTRDTMQKNLGSLTATSWSYTQQDRGETIYSTSISDTIKVNSDWIDDAQSSWLQQLVESPDVYMLESGQLTPVVIKNTRYDRKTIKNERLFNLEIEFKYANKRWTQRG